ncbi:major capsid protein [Chromohalobacter israelensis]|uniref:major capsid protein n=1 Tax=Chromohalobacter israelensis TaxID=141390 RepID=UPI000D7128FA|nr:major capsid protein [Chromohalobacter salexigens]PWW28763.1 major capsid protein E [Chromohalobacter salexigens]
MLVDNEKIMDRTEAINKIPAKPALIGSMGFFKTRNVASDYITFDKREGSLKVINDKLRSTADKNTTDDKSFDQHVLKIPHYPVTSTITRDQLAGVRSFDSESEKSVAAALAEHLGDHSDMIDYHHEYQQAKMLFNAQLVTDNFGTYDLATELGVAQGTKTLSYTNAGDTLKQFREMQNASKAGLIGGRAQGFILFAGDDLYEWLLANGDFERAMQMNGWTGANPLMNEVGSVGAGYQAFTFGGTTIVNYNDSFTLPDGSQDQILPTAEGLLVPRAQLGKHFFGPENTLSGLSRGGQRAFSRTVRDDRDRFVTVESETNSLPILESVGASIKVDFTP